jgi:hypothetical protein
MSAVLFKVKRGQTKTHSFFYHLRPIEADAISFLDQEVRPEENLISD